MKYKVILEVKEEPGISTDVQGEELDREVTAEVTQALNNLDIEDHTVEKVQVSRADEKQSKYPPEMLSFCMWVGELAKIEREDFTYQGRTKEQSLAFVLEQMEALCDKF